jgi:hypothetical protein
MIPLDAEIAAFIADVARFRAMVASQWSIAA